MSLGSDQLQLAGRPVLSIDGMDDDPLFEMVMDFSGGVDTYRRSTLIGQNQCQKLENIIIRDNYEAWTRPGADAFASPLAAAIRSLCYFETQNNRVLLTIAGGSLMISGGKGQDFALPDMQYASDSADIAVEMIQAVDQVLLADGVKAMTILHDSLEIETCGTDPETDPPYNATILCFHTGRMFAAGMADARDTVAVSNRLAYGTGQWNMTQRSFRVGAGDGDPIVALHSLPGTTLCVGKANSICLLDTPPSKDSDGFTAATDVESVSFGVGVVGKRAMCSYGNDLFFMAQDGVRSLQRMQAAAGQWQLSAPLSQPVQRYIARINRAYHGGIVATSCKEFVFFAVPLDASTVNNATLVYNTRLNAWLGCWFGWTPTCFCRTRFDNVEQLLIGDSAGGVNFWKDTADSDNPTTYADNGVPIASTVWTRSFQFGMPANNKKARNCELRFTSGQSTAKLDAVMDLLQAKTWSEPFSVTGDILGVGHLGPFQLASIKPVQMKRGLRGLPSFNEMFLSISTAAGFMKLRSVTVAAFLEALKG